MKTIFGYDSAAKNMGVCVVRFDDEWRGKAAELIARAHSLITGGARGPALLNKMVTLLRDVNAFLDQRVTVRYFNTFDLIPGQSVEESNMEERTARLKRLLTTLDSHLDPPDVVLIEHQMCHNDKSRTLSNQIGYHYMPVVPWEFQEFQDPRRPKTPPPPAKAPRKGRWPKAKAKPIPKAKAKPGLKNFITYAVAEFAPHAHNSGVSSPLVEIVGTSLKNSIEFGTDRVYADFVADYSNYVANKKHAIHNFEAWVRLYSLDQQEMYGAILNKTDDIADSFMMVYGWMVKQKWL
jgi:hypothetical protein